MAWIVEWGWMKQFPFYLQEGETTKSKWENRIAFAKARLLPATIEEHKVRKGKVYFTQGVVPAEFDLRKL
jgi:hypothetical protein